VTNAEIDFTSNGVSYQLPVPDAAVTYSPTATTASTSFDSTDQTWESTIPAKLGGNAFLSGLSFPVASTLSGGINPVTWTATFTSNVPGLSVNWQWATAVYTSFGSSYSSLNVKPVDDNQASVYKDSDQAGTPEAFRSFVTGGARGGG
jgi:hypothetical protein